MAPQKRVHNTLTLSEKCKILYNLHKGKSVRAVASEFKVPKSTVYDIKNKKTSIRAYVSNTFHGIGKRKIMKTGEHPEVEKALYLWFLQQRSLHIPITSDILREKAKVFYKKITGKSNFLASSGWLDKFKGRYGIRHLKVCGERISSDASAVKPFQDKIAKLISEMELSKEQIYNCDESAAFWRALPNTTWVHEGEKSAPGRKISKDRLTFMPCSNAAGTHKLPLLVIGKALNPRPFKNAKLPVTYAASKKGWMSKALFKKWFKETFVPEVTKFLKDNNRPLKALLILDNAPSHPNEEEIIIDENFKLLFLPPNCTALLQPLDQNLIQNIKVSYRKKLLKHLLNQKSIDVSTRLKMFNIKNAVDFLAEAWDSITERNIKSSWKLLLPQNSNWDEEDLISLADLQRQLIRDSSSADLQEIQNCVREIDPGISLSNEQINEWACGENESVLELEDEDFIEDASSAPTSEIDSADNITSRSKIKDSEALQCLSVLLQYAEDNEFETQDILLLKRLREKVQSKVQCAYKQRTITSFFTN